MLAEAAEVLEFIQIAVSSIYMPFSQSFDYGTESGPSPRQDFGSFGALFWGGEMSLQLQGTSEALGNDK